ncbi:nickel-binding protein [Nocardioides piscis]|uniref:nickel-binding protein n=1 Tax=Nocardioides piscis TaxID=2714938 RepID=UPI003CCE2300
MSTTSATLSGSTRSPRPTWPTSPSRTSTTKYLRYWVDEAHGKIFCLAEAPSADAAATVHREPTAWSRRRSMRSGRALSKHRAAQASSVSTSTS